MAGGLGEWWDGVVENMCVSLRGCILDNMTDMFDSVNVKVDGISTNLSQTPQTWNSTVFGLIQNISDNVIVPIGGMVLTFVVCYEIISLLLEKNNMHDFETSNLMRIIMKMGIGVYVMSHTWEICMAFFDVAQNVVQKAGGLVNAGGTLAVSQNFEAELNLIKNPFDLLGILVLTEVVSWFMGIIGVAITLAIAGRFIEIYIYCSISPIPFATFLNREWGQIGYNYVRGIIALAFQGFFMMICVAVYVGMLQNLNVVSGDIQGALIETAGYSVLLVLALFKTNQISKSIFNAH